MKSFQKIVLSFLLLVIARRCDAKSDKSPPVVVRPPVPVQTPSPTDRPTQSPVEKPISVPGFIQMDLDTFEVNFESMDGSAILVKEDLLKDSSERYFEDFIESLDDSDPVKQKFIGISIKVKLSSIRKNLRRLQNTALNAEVGGSITFLENGAPAASAVKDVQEKAFSDSLFASRLENSFDNVNVKVLYDGPDVENENPNIAGTTIGGKKTGGTVGGVVGAFAAIGLFAFAFVQYKRRKTTQKSNEEHYLPEVHVEAADVGADGEQNFEAVVMSPTFSIQDSVKMENSARRGFKMPIGTKVKSFSSRKSGMSVTGHEEYDAYSLDGSMALGQKPNLGDQMLGQVLAMSQYTPASDDVNFNDEMSPEKPRMIRVSSNNSMDSFHHDCSFDSPSVMGGVSVSGNSMMSESIVAHGRTLTIGSRQSFAHINSSSKKEIPGDDSSGDGIEVAIDAVSNSDSASLSNSNEGNTASLATPPRTAPGESTSSFSPARTILNFSPKEKEDYKVNIVETEQALRSNSKIRNDDTKKKTYRGNRQVQRVEGKHKVTITTESSNPALVRSSFPIQSARTFESEDAKDDDSYSSYYSSENEEEAISTLLRNAREQVKQQSTSNAEIVSSHNKNQSKTTTKTSKPTAGHSMFPVRIAQQYPTHRTPTNSSNTDSLYMASSRKVAIENTIKSKGISTTNYAAEARRNRMARNAVSSNKARKFDEGDQQSIANQVASLRRARLQQRTWK